MEEEKKRREGDRKRERSKEGEAFKEINGEWTMKLKVELYNEILPESLKSQLKIKSDNSEF